MFFLSLLVPPTEDDAPITEVSQLSSEEDPTDIVAISVTDTPVSSVRGVLSDTPTATITSTSEPLRDSESNSNGLDATRLEVAINSFSDVEVQSIEIVDGRSSGGERSAIIAYTNSGFGSELAALELLGVLLAVGDAIDEFSIDLDAVLLIYAPTAIVTGKAQDRDWETT